MDNPLHCIDDDLDSIDSNAIILPPLEYASLDHDVGEQRFFLLQASATGQDRNAESNYVHCTLQTAPVTQAGPYVAIRNARGYRLYKQPIRVDHGRESSILQISVALEKFLRHLRPKSGEPPLLIWTRYLSLEEFNRAETNIYWNRSFVDSMYAQAALVLDMAQMMAELVDNGIVQAVRNQLTEDREKRWLGEDGRPCYQSIEGPVMPAIFPRRLGTQVGPAETFNYVPLDTVTEEIRLLCLPPAATYASYGASSTLDARLAHCPLYCEVEYICLSYTWGQPFPTSPLSLTGQVIQVRENVARFLFLLQRGSRVLDLYSPRSSGLATDEPARVPNQPIAIWIDALCINQGDVLERNRSVRRMAEIYFRATHVLCYIGEPDEDSELALELVPYLGKGVPPQRDGKGHWVLTSDWGSPSEPNRLSHERLARLCGALYRFLTRPYFRRVWIIQEVALASNPTIICGNHIWMAFENLDESAANLLYMLIQDPGLAFRVLAATPGLESLRASDLEHIRKLYYFRHIVSRGSSVGFQSRTYAAFQEGSPRILETAIQTRTFEATDARDKLFALWTLSKDTSGIKFEVDYSRTVGETYATFARAWIVSKASLDVIGAAEPGPEPEPSGSRNSKQDLEVWPSWCPDWSVPATTSCLVRREHIPARAMATVESLDGPLYSADGMQGVAPPSLFSLDPNDDNILRCTALVLDQIALVLVRPPPIPAEPVRFVPPSVNTYWTERHYRKLLNSHYSSATISDNAKGLYDDVDQAAKAMFRGDVPLAWPSNPARAADPAHVLGSADDDFYVCDTTKSRHVQRYGGQKTSYDNIQAWDVVGKVMHGRRVCVTEKGYMALIPEWVAERWEKKTEGQRGQGKLAVLAGCSVPVVLMEVDGSDNSSAPASNASEYRLCGTAFVQGWMEGEMVLSERSGLDQNAESIWEAGVGGQAKEICIV